MTVASTVRYETGAYFAHEGRHSMRKRASIDMVAIAQGIVMNQQGIGPCDAAHVLFCRADDQARPLLDVAADLVASGEHR